MNYYKNDIRHVRGDTFTHNIYVEGLNQDLESVYFTCRDNLTDESNVLFQKSLGDGITLTDQNEDIYSNNVRVAPEDTRDIQSGTYYYDLQININEDIFTIMRGKFIIEQDCTWEEK